MGGCLIFSPLKEKIIEENFDEWLYRASYGHTDKYSDINK